MSENSKREELRQVVGRIYDESLAGLVWKKVGRMLAWLPGLNRREAPIWLASLIVLVLNVLACAILAELIGAPEAFSRVGFLFVTASSIWIWLSINLADWQFRNNLNIIQQDGLEILKLPEGESQVMEWVRVFTSRRNQVVIAVSFVILVVTLSSSVIKLDFSLPISRVILLYLFLATGWWSFHVAGLAALTLFYGFYFGRWKTSLFQDDPASTTALLTLHRSAGQLLLVLALIIAMSIPVGWVVNMLTPDTLLFSGVSLWFPMLIFYVTTEHSFAVQIRQAKRQRLTQLQKQISELEQGLSAPNMETLKQVRELLEFHEQVKRKTNSLINMDSVLNLLGSLALPLLGALINILDIWRKLFSVP